MNNYERIMNMTPSELAEEIKLIANWDRKDKKVADKHDSFYLDWLNAESKEFYGKTNVILDISFYDLNANSIEDAKIKLLNSMVNVKLIDTKCKKEIPFKISGIQFVNWCIAENDNKVVLAQTNLNG